MFHTLGSHLVSACWASVGISALSSVSARYPERVEYSPFMFLSQTLVSSARNLLGLMLRIWALCIGKHSSIFGISHSKVPVKSRSETLRCCRCSGAGPYGLSCSLCDSHGSFQTFIDSPFPTIQPSCFTNRSPPTSTLRQPCDAVEGAFTSRKVSVWQYLPSRHRASKLVGFFMMRQPIFARSASLKEVISLNRSPPLLFGFAILSQEIQDTFLFPGSESHQNLVRVDCMLEQTDCGILGTNGADLLRGCFGKFYFIFGQSFGKCLFFW